jgi:hypothetical protein
VYDPPRPSLDPDAKEHVKAEAKIAADLNKDFPIEPLGSGIRREGSSAMAMRSI